jgi:hypothetical protein
VRKSVPFQLKLDNFREIAKVMFWAHRIHERSDDEAKTRHQNGSTQILTLKLSQSFDRIPEMRWAEMGIP